ncbi:MAG TPA: type II toxin-antitoxin system HicB family antitoxin [Spirochaetota bacterium]|nr:type II toxin-antitoxin system HicB family antitoxin [Spirochaetota bacterium]HOR43548.1 type II toxin-antitoxin system HicB family antitoxin [Spirochaetota bacterium]HPK55708.1 type II toxin-antitoxin system HicB family antitoxin [Spirochaetota bacterium]
MKRVEYFAKIEFNKEDGVFEVSFPDLPTIHTFGDTKDEALEMAQDALSGYLEVAYKIESKIPKAAEHKGKNLYLIRPSANIALAVILRWEREKRGYSQKEVAEKLGVAYQVYQKIETPKLSNPTLKTLEKLGKIFDLDLISI